MKSGVIHPSRMTGATVAEDVGTWTAAMPLDNVLDIIRPSQIARASSSGERHFIVDFPGKVSVQAIAIIGHNAPDGATLSVEGYFGAGGTGSKVYDSGSVSFYPGTTRNTRYRAIRPFILSAAVSVRSLWIKLGSNASPWEIEAVEAGGFWEWLVGYDRGLGVSPDASRVTLTGGPSYAPDRPGGPRIVSGSIDRMPMAEAGAAGMDFQRQTDLQKPFVFGEDLENGAAWARKCLLVRNEELPKMVGALYRHDTFPFSLIEHKR